MQRTPPAVTAGASKTRNDARVRSSSASCIQREISKERALDSAQTRETQATKRPLERAECPPFSPGELRESATEGGMKTAGLKRQEKQMLEKCKVIIANMKAAAEKQRNTSNQMKLGLLELEDAIEAMASFRSKWEEIESEAQKLAIQEASKEAERPTPADKRPASSPAGKNHEKRKRKDSLYEEITVISKREKQRRKAEGRKRELLQSDTMKTADPLAGTGGRDNKKRRHRTRPEAVLIKPGAGQSYADVLREIRKNVSPENTGTNVRSIRQTRSGGVLLEIGEEAAGKGALREAIKTILGERANVTSLEPKCTIEIRDLDCITEEADIREALERDIPDLGEVAIGLTQTNTRGQRVAVAELKESSAMTLLKQQKIRIGWVQCRVRKRVIVQRCFRCHGYGHIARDCKGPDRSALCYKCGEAGHRAKVCNGPQHCVLCASRGLNKEQASHVPGSGRCSVFREELEKAKARVR